VNSIDLVVRPLPLAITSTSLRLPTTPLHPPPPLPRPEPGKVLRLQYHSYRRRLCSDSHRDPDHDRVLGAWQRQPPIRARPLPELLNTLQSIIINPLHPPFHRSSSWSKFHTTTYHIPNRHTSSTQSNGISAPTVSLSVITLAPTAITANNNHIHPSIHPFINQSIRCGSVVVVITTWTSSTQPACIVVFSPTAAAGIEPALTVPYDRCG
jgi:hypothetical protein